MLEAFSMMDNLRLIVIVAIFIGIIVVLLYLKSAKSGRKTERKYMQATDPYDRSSKEEIRAKNVENFEDILGSEAEIEAELNDGDGKIETMLGADMKDVRAEITTKIEELILKTGEGEKEVINKVENVIDKKVQEVLSKINDRIDEVLQAQKDSTALVLEKIIDSLRQKEEPVGIKSSKQSKKEVDQKVEFEEITERDLDVTDEDSDKLGMLDSSLQKDGKSVGVSFSDESGYAEVVEEVPEKIKEEDLEIPFEVSEDIKAEAAEEEEEQIASSEVIEKNVLEVDKADSADFDIQEFLEELENLPSEQDPEAEK